MVSSVAHALICLGAYVFDFALMGGIIWSTYAPPEKPPAKSVLPLLQAASEFKIYLAKLMTQEPGAKVGAYEFCKYFWHHQQALKNTRAVDCWDFIRSMRELTQIFSRSSVSFWKYYGVFRVSEGQVILLAECVSKGHEMMSYEEFTDKIANDGSCEVHAMHDLYTLPTSKTERAMAIERIREIQKKLSDICTYIEKLRNEEDKAKDKDKAKYV